jgi:3-phosphoshikimate 1-carboxyvinyltransferase
MLGSIADGVTRVSGFLEGEDSLATLKAFKALGVNIEGPENGNVSIHGVGLHGLKANNEALDLGNSGTSMRLMSGLLSAQKFETTLAGDSSLNQRPMKRVIDPLTQMGATIVSEDNGTAPLNIKPAGQINAIDYQLPMASAQVKSCILLAGLYASGTTTVTEPAPTRDHTERMLRGFGCEVITEKNVISLKGGQSLTATDIDVPSDISSATFFIVGAAIAKDSDIILQHVGMNPTRIGIVNIMRAMGASIEISNEKTIGGEPVADLHIVHRPLKGIHIPTDQVPLAIDEFPAIFIAAACAEGETVLTGAEELRVKESDRIQVMADGLNILGIDAESQFDGIKIQGGQLTQGEVDSHGDHRIAMSFAMAALRAQGEITINNCDNVQTSFPSFVHLAKSSGLIIREMSSE